MDVRSPIIIEELQSMQSPLASWPVAMPFRVPDNYFAAFPEQLKLVLQAETAPDSVPAFGKLDLPFTISQNYFDQFASDLTGIIEAEAITESFSRKPAFAVPEGYFAGFAGAVMAAIAQEEVAEPALNGFPKTNAFAVPEGYFDGLAGSVMEAIETESVEETLPRKVAFTVPEGYFNDFATQLRARIAAEETPKVIPLRPRRMIPIQVARWAAAAALVIGVFTGIRNADAPKVATETTQRALAAVPEVALQDYISQHADDFDVDMIEAHLPQSSFEKASPAGQLETREIQSFLTEETLL